MASGRDPHSSVAERQQPCCLRSGPRRDQLRLLATMRAQRPLSIEETASEMHLYALLRIGADLDR